MKPAAFLFALVASTTMATAQSHKDPHASHMAHTIGISEPGQSAFGAIAEIVARLNADPSTDWSRVDIAALRAHLVDMDRVTLWSTVTTEPAEFGLRFTVTGTGDTIGSIRRMTHAHATMMQGQWRYDVSDIEGGVSLTVATPQSDLPKLTGLGFFGIMASGMHHQLHHFMLAKGDDPH